MAPGHALIFDGLTRAIVERARRRASRSADATAEGRGPSERHGP
jgi:hypothetical protein